jgi:hypothetical protein
MLGSELGQHLDLATCTVSREKKKIRAELRELGRRGGLKGTRDYSAK